MVPTVTKGSTPLRTQETPEELEEVGNRGCRPTKTVNGPVQVRCTVPTVRTTGVEDTLFTHLGLDDHKIGASML